MLSEPPRFSAQRKMCLVHVTEIVMTPTKSGKVTSIKFEKVKRAQIDESRVAHKAGGQHTGLVINKQTAGL